MTTLAIIVFLLNLADGLSTSRVLKAGGVEKMWLQRVMFAKIGFWPWIVTKGALLGLLAWFAPWQAGVLLSAMYFVVVTYNICVHKKLTNK